MDIPPISGASFEGKINPESSDSLKIIWENLQRNFSSFYIHGAQLDHYFYQNPTGSNVAGTDIASRMADLVSCEWNDMKSDVGKLMQDHSSPLYTNGALNNVGKTFQDLFSANQFGHDLMTTSFLFQAIKNPTESVGGHTYSQIMQSFFSENSTVDSDVLAIMREIYPSLEKGNEAPHYSTIIKTPFPPYLGTKIYNGS